MLAVIAAAGAAARFVHSCLAAAGRNSLLLYPLIACLFVALAAWKRIGLVSLMATTAGSEVAAAAAAQQDEMLVFPTKAGGTEQLTWQVLAVL